MSDSTTPEKYRSETEDDFGTFDFYGGDYESLFWDSDHEHYEGTKFEIQSFQDDRWSDDSQYLEIIDVIEGREFPLYEL